MADEMRTYRFGTLERSGFLGGLRKGQLLLLGVCAAVAFCGFLLLGARHASAGIVLALLCGAVGSLGAFMPVAGQPLVGLGAGRALVRGPRAAGSRVALRAAWAWLHLG